MQISSEEGYRLWAPSYDCTPNPLIALEQRLVSGLLRNGIPGRVVDLACGTGRWSRYFAARGDSVWGVDSCEAMLTAAAAGKQLQGRLAMGSADELPIGSSVADLTICSFAMSYVRDLQCAFAEMARVTRRGGTILVSDMHPSAVAAGWTRSFKRNGTRYEIASSGYSLESLYRAASRAGLHLTAQAEAAFGEPERSLFELAGKAHLLETLKRIPAVWIGIWEQPCC